MPVNLPVWTSQPLAACLSPLTDCGVSLPQTAVRPQVGDDRDAAARRSRPHDTILFGKRPHHLNAGLKANRTIPIDRHVPAGCGALSS